MPCDPERAPSLYHWGALWGQREELSTGRPPARIGAAMQIEFLKAARMDPVTALRFE